MSNNFQQYNNEELVAIYNREVGISAWGNARARFLYELAKELKLRNFNSDCIFRNGNLSLNQKVILENNSLFLLNSN